MDDWGVALESSVPWAPGWIKVASKSHPGAFYYAHLASKRTQAHPPKTMHLELSSGKEPAGARPCLDQMDDSTRKNRESMDVFCGKHRTFYGYLEARYTKYTVPQREHMGMFNYVEGGQNESNHLLKKTTLTMLEDDRLKADAFPGVFG